MVVAEQDVRIDYRNLLAEIRGDPGRHGRHLRADVGNAGLEDIPMTAPAGFVSLQS